MLRWCVHLGLRALPTHLRVGAAPAATRRAVHSGRPAAALSQPPPQMEEVLRCRAHRRSSGPTLNVRVAGVSFENRQAAVAKLHPGEGIAFQREPTNEFDPNAVAVHTLEGTPLGYVPRGQTSAFPLPFCFGAVHSVGLGASGNWGFNADVQPSVPPMVVLAVPDSLRGRSRVAPLLSGNAWARARAAVIEGGGGRCAVSGAPNPEASERWDFDDSRRVMRLAGFAALAPEVVSIQHMLESGAELHEPLRQMNAWSEDDMARYLAHVAAVQARRSEQPWRLDLSELGALGLEVPLELEGYAV